MDADDICYQSLLADWQFRPSGNHERFNFILAIADAEIILLIRPEVYQCLNWVLGLLWLWCLWNDFVDHQGLAVYLWVWLLLFSCGTAQGQFSVQEEHLALAEEGRLLWLGIHKLWQPLSAHGSGRNLSCKLALAKLIPPHCVTVKSIFRLTLGNYECWILEESLGQLEAASHRSFRSYWKCPWGEIGQLFESDFVEFLNWSSLSRRQPLVTPSWIICVRKSLLIPRSSFPSGNKW